MRCIFLTSMVKKIHFSLDKTNSMLYTISTMRHRRNILHRKTFLITGLQIARLERLAKETDQNLSELIRRAIDTYLDDQEKSLGLTTMRWSEVESENVDS
ncbi:ribbon-helix-helix protein, CopG family [Candidatus Poribacteria bacterium]|nr:ribbon-helix-helix protein, CopG family [Candidatus Poribacteria bacterium]